MHPSTPCGSMRNPHRSPRPRRANGFYDSPEWKHIRRLVLIRDGYRCTVCGRDVRGKGKARVDHIISMHERPDLALVMSNLRTLDAEHDNQAHREKPKGKGAGRDARFTIRGADASGMPIDPGHPWLNGR